MTYQERTQNNRISNEEMIDGRNCRIESETDFDVLNYNEFTIDVINRFGNDGETQTVNIYGKTTDEIIQLVKSL